MLQHVHQTLHFHWTVKTVQKLRFLLSMHMNCRKGHVMCNFSNQHCDLHKVKVFRNKICHTTRKGICMVLTLHLLSNTSHMFKSLCQRAIFAQYKHQSFLPYVALQKHYPSFFSKEHLQLLHTQLQCMQQKKKGALPLSFSFPDRQV